MMYTIHHHHDFLNAGSFRGNAQGVKVSFLGEMKSTKAPNGAQSIKPYLSCHLKRCSENWHLVS